MGHKTGDKARFHRKRRQKLARRVAMRALAKELAASSPAGATVKSPPSGG